MSDFKDYVTSLWAKRSDSEQESIPENVESSVTEPSNPSDTSDIYTSQYKAPAESKTGKSVILRDMIVYGNVESASDIDIMGSIQGEVKSAGRIFVSGRVSGNISGRTVNICTKEVKANVFADERVNIDRGTVINGNVSSESVIVNGEVNGNITASKELVVMAGALIKGDITAAMMEVNRGAVINGKVTFTTKQNQD